MLSIHLTRNQAVKSIPVQKWNSLQGRQVHYTVAATGASNDHGWSLALLFIYAFSKLTIVLTENLYCVIFLFFCCSHLLVVFGGLAGLEAVVDADENLHVSDASLLFHHYLNTCPGQGSSTIRTEVCTKFIIVNYNTISNNKCVSKTHISPYAQLIPGGIVHGPRAAKRIKKLHTLLVSLYF